MRVAKLVCLAIASVLLSTVLLAVGSEVAMRRAAASRPDNDYTTVTWGHKVIKNSFGFREREVLPKATGVYRIMVVGDSLTWGAGLHEKQRYTYLLQLFLEVKFPRRRIEVLNFALSGAPTTHERDVLLKHVDSVQPDLVVVGWCMNDPQPRDQAWCPEKEAFDRKLEALRSIGLKEVASSKAIRFLGPDWIDALDRTYRPESTEWANFENALRDMAKACRDRSLPTPILALLLLGDGDFNQPDRHLSKMLEWASLAGAAAEKAGFRSVSMEKAFRAEGYRQRCVNQWDGHPDAQCNRVYAEELAKAIAPIIKRTFTKGKDSSHEPRNASRRNDQGCLPD